MPDRRILAACISSSIVGMFLSALLHSNWSVPNIYSDIGSFWGRSWVSAGLPPNTSVSTFFEYPPISGFLLYGSRVLGGSLAGLAGGIYNAYYFVFSFLSVVAAGIIAWSTFRLSRRMNIQVNPLYFLLPSVIVYGVYNFDLFNAMFIVLSVQLYAEQRRELSAVLLGLAMATKLVAVVLLPVFILDLDGADYKIKYTALALAFAALPFFPIVISFPGFFGQFLSYFSNWGLEDAWYIWIFGDPFSRAAKAFGLVLLMVLLVRVYTLKVPLVQKCFLALCAYLLATPIYAPQFNVMLVPLVAVLAISSPALFSWDVFNAMIILTWFTVPQTPTFGPTHAWTVPQAAALIRSASLAIMGLSVASASGH